MWADSQHELKAMTDIFIMQTLQIKQTLFLFSPNSFYYRNREEHIYMYFSGHYRLALWVKFSAEDILKYAFIFPNKQDLTFYWEIVSNGDNMHIMSNPVFWKK